MTKSRRSNAGGTNTHLLALDELGDELAPLRGPFEIGNLRIRAPAGEQTARLAPVSSTHRDQIPGSCVSSWLMPPTRAVTIRRCIASVTSIALGALLFREFHGLAIAGSTAERLFLDSIIATPIVAAALIWSTRLGAQLLARGVWWSMLLIGGLMATAGANSERPAGAYIAIATAIALLVVGGSGLAENRGRFAPVAFRGTLLVALVLAIADTGAFTFYGVGTALSLHRASSIVLLVPLMLTGVIGLLQLKTWGLIVSLCTNLLIASLALTGTLALPPELRWLFVGTTVLQLVVPIPMIVAIIRNTQPRPDGWQRAKIVVPAITISAIALLSIYAGLVHHGRLLRF